MTYLGKIWIIAFYAKDQISEDLVNYIKGDIIRRANELKTHYEGIFGKESPRQRDYRKLPAVIKISDIIIREIEHEYPFIACSIIE